MNLQQQQILVKCKEVIAKAKELYNLDLSDVRISFDLRGRAAGKAGGRGYRMEGRNYYVKFNRDMLGREAFDHVLNDTVPHEFAHVVCFMNPLLGSNHNPGWKRVCIALGGGGSRTHSEAVVYGNGGTYEYTTTFGKKVRLSEQKHSQVQRGRILTYRDRSYGVVNSSSPYSVVGYQGRALVAPIPVNWDGESGPAPVQVAAPFVKPAPKTTHTVPMVPVSGGKTKADLARALMVKGHAEGLSYEEIIQAIMLATGHNRQLSRAYYKNNAARCGVPQM